MYCVDAHELRKAMIDSNYNTVVSLADASGVDRNTISAILSGRTKPSAVVIEKLAKALNLDSEGIGRIFFSKKLA